MKAIGSGERTGSDLSALARIASTHSLVSLSSDSSSGWFQMEWITDLVAVSKFDKNWSPVRFDQLEWRWWRDCKLTDAMEVFLIDKWCEEMVEAIWMVFESAVSDRVHDEE